jgi:FAD/FMN-containing dehydrogenase
MAIPQSISVEKLISGFSGKVLRSGDKGYDDARRVWNGMIDRRPAIIAQCRTSEDVAKAVNFGRDNNMLISVKGGGHNAAGTAVSDGGLMIDLSPMREIRVDKDKMTASVAGGCLLAEVDKATQRFGLAIPAGIISETGIGGLTVGGGFGWLSRKHGLTIDHLRSAEVVTADGRIVQSDANTNDDLFWAIRGGGGNFGIVTRFDFDCVEIGTSVFSGLIVKKFENAREYLRFHRDYIEKLPDEMTVWAIIRNAPPLPFLPSDVHGKLILAVAFVWLGERAEGEALIEPIRNATESHGEGIGMNPWVDWQSGFDALESSGARDYWKSHFIKALADEFIDRVVESAGKLPGEECAILLVHMDGATARIPETETAYSHREAPYILNLHTRWRQASDDERCLQWVRKLHKSTEEFASGVYVNFISQEGEDRVKAAYTPEVWKRLVQIKRKWDPNNLFRMNQNIKPVG